MMLVGTRALNSHHVLLTLPFGYRTKRAECQRGLPVAGRSGRPCRACGASRQMAPGGGPGQQGQWQPCLELLKWQWRVPAWGDTGPVEKPGLAQSRDLRPPAGSPAQRALPAESAKARRSEAASWWGSPQVAAWRPGGGPPRPTEAQWSVRWVRWPALRRESATGDCRPTSSLPEAHPSRPLKLPRYPHMHSHMPGGCACACRCAAGQGNIVMPVPVRRALARCRHPDRPEC
jgi:hypothetical protein